MNFSSVSGKNWLFRKFDSSDIIKYTENYSLTEIVAKLLSIRKNNINDINFFLNPKIKNFLPNPLHLKDMKSAIERTYKSINSGEIMGIFGDYDVDGASSTALLARYFLSINQKYKHIYQTDGQRVMVQISVDLKILLIMGQKLSLLLIVELYLLNQLNLHKD